MTFFTLTYDKLLQEMEHRTPIMRNAMRDTARQWRNITFLTPNKIRFCLLAGCIGPTYGVKHPATTTASRAASEQQQRTMDLFNPALQE